MISVGSLSSILLRVSLFPDSLDRIIIASLSPACPSALKTMYDVEFPWYDCWTGARLPSLFHVTGKESRMPHFLCSRAPERWRCTRLLSYISSLFFSCLPTYLVLPRQLSCDYCSCVTLLFSESLKACSSFPPPCVVGR